MSLSDHFRLYDLRHTFATRAMAAGVDLPTLSAILGHMNIQMTMRYVHPAQEPKRLAAGKQETFRLAGIMEAIERSRGVTTKVTTVSRDPRRSREVKPKVLVVPLSGLVLDEKNANKGTKRGRELLGESLEKYGAGRSVVVDCHDREIAGNKTVEAARAAGMKSIAVIESDGSSPVAVQRGDLDLKRDKKARELVIADNRVGEVDLDWNPEVLASLDIDLDLFWNENELSALLKGFRTS